MMSSVMSMMVLPVAIAMMCFFLFFVFVYTLSIAPAGRLSIGVSRLTLVVLVE